MRRVSFVFVIIQAAGECRHLDAEPHEGAAVLDEIVRICHAVALNVRAARVLRVRPPVIAFGKKSCMPPALRGLCEAVMVIGVSFKYWLAAFRTRDSIEDRDIELACAEVGPKTANTTAAIVSRRVILSLERARPAIPLECGGNRSATLVWIPLSLMIGIIKTRTKASSPLRFAGALQISLLFQLKGFAYSPHPRPPTVRS